jgi:hypothetical protein
VSDHFPPAAPGQDPQAFDPAAAFDRPPADPPAGFGPPPAADPPTGFGPPASFDPAAWPPPTSPPYPPEAVPGLAPAPVRSRRRRWIALGVAAALVALAAAGGIGYAVTRGDDGGTKNTPAASGASHPRAKAFGARSGGSHYGSLGLMLLPVPDDFEPGPDIETYGNDAVLDAGRAQDLMRQNVASLPAKDRKAYDATLRDMHIEGAGLRTYQGTTDDLVISVQILQMRNKVLARDDTRLFGAITKAMHVFRPGPKITGHPYATCVLSPSDREEKIDSMLCRATEGDLLVTLSATAPKPMDTSAAAGLLAKQLDRIQDPGEAV